MPCLISQQQVVSNTSKVLKRKQITTPYTPEIPFTCCFQYIKGTKKKANHNVFFKVNPSTLVVSNTSKVLKRKQITTLNSTLIRPLGCFQYIKGTKKKANHNTGWLLCHSVQLFPIHQRY